MSVKENDKFINSCRNITIDKENKYKAYDSQTSCLHHDTLATLKSGAQIPLKELKVGDMIQTGTGIYEPVLIIIKHTSSNDIVRVLKLHMSNSSLILTPKHYVITSNGLKLA